MGVTVPPGRPCDRKAGIDFQIGEGPVHYQHRQRSRPVVVSCIAMTAILIAPLLYPSGRQAPFAAILVAALALELVAHYLLFSLTVEVSAHELSWYFGPGVWRRRVARSSIAHVARVRLPWWYGIGVKYTPRAWVYLVAPGAGVEVALTNGEAVRIGTDDAEGLLTALTKPL